MADSINTEAFSQITVTDIITFAIIIAASIIVGKIVSNYLKKTISDRMGKEDLANLQKVTQICIFLAGLFIALPFFKVNLSGILVAGGFLGIIIGFASQSVVSNLVSGVFLYIERPVRIGDNISINKEVTGFVEDIRMMSTIIRTGDGVYVRVPNQTVFTSELTNYVENAARRLEYRVDVACETDTGMVIETIKTFLKDEPYVLHYPKPEIFVDKLGDYSVTIRILTWIPSVRWWTVRKELLEKIRDLLIRSGVELPYPQQVIWMKR